MTLGGGRTGVIALGYLGLGVSDTAAWRTYLGEGLGADVMSLDDGSLRARVDSRAWRLAVEPTGEDDVAYVGWETGGAEALDDLSARLVAAGVAVERPDRELARRRGVVDLVRFRDPAGVVCELFWGATELFEQPLVSPCGVTSFVAGALGLGHVVIGTADPAAYGRFYKELLGFRLSDFIDIQRPGGVAPFEFLHCNARHHTLAFGPAPVPRKLLHFMLQVGELDDVGRALDRIKASGGKLAQEIGRHTNDHMVSFYAVTPSGFHVEYGWGAREVGPDWVPVRHDRTSYWGHERPGA